MRRSAAFRFERSNASPMRWVLLLRIYELPRWSSNAASNRKGRWDYGADRFGWLNNESLMER